MLRSRPGFLLGLCKRLTAVQLGSAPAGQVSETLLYNAGNATRHGTPLISKHVSWVHPMQIFPFTTTSTSSASVLPDWYVRLNTLSDNPGATKERRRVGRGMGNGRGKTCGRGHKGQKARKGSGKPHLLFDGGNEVLRKLPKRGGATSNPVVYSFVNLGRIAHWIKAMRLDPSHVITMKDLRDSGCARKKIRWGIKLLSRGAQHLKLPIHIQVSSCSQSAREAVEKLGGSVTTTYYTPLGLRALLKPERFAALGRDVPGPVRTFPPRDIGKFDIVGQIPPPRELPIPAATTATALASASA